MSLFSRISDIVIKSAVKRKAKNALPLTSGEIIVPGVSKPVEVIRDKWGVPHIYASNFNDLLFAQGYVHAQDRLWQMEINRRLATGRLSEILGPLALDTDRLTRTMGFSRLAEKDSKSYDPKLMNLMDAYVAGINAFIKSPGQKFPVEFKLLKYEPAEWTTLDSLAFSRMMIWEMCFVWYHSIVRAKIMETVGEAAAKELEIEYPDENPVKLPSGIEFNKILEDGKLQAFQGPFLNPVGGSNAWAVSATLTNTEKPILCNDPHLPLMMPAIWHEIHMQSPNYHCSGVSLPGLPLVMIGHNENIAWGITLAFTDLQDLFVEKFTDESCTKYLFENEERNSVIHEETIKVKDETDHVETVIETHHGPVISDVLDTPDQKVTLCSMALKEIGPLLGWNEINHARNWDQFVTGVKHIDAPGLNITYADTNGNIGYWVTGKVPVRKNGYGLVPMPGWTGEYEWVGHVPFEEMPHLFNPEKNWLVTCNHKIVGDNYPHYLGSTWMNGYRANRLEEIFKRGSNFSVKDFMKLQLDFKCIPGLQFAQHFTNIKSENPKTKEAIRLLVKWDGELTKSSAAGCIYQVTKHFLIHNILDPVLGEELAKQYRGGGFHPILSPMSEYMGHDSVAILRMLDNPNSWWIEKSGGKEFVLKKAIEDAVKWLAKELGNDPHKWRWGKLHTVEFSHTMSTHRPLNEIFDRGPYPISGDTDTVCQMAFRPHEPYGKHIVGPSFRQVIDLEDFSKSKVVMPPGQSGHVASTHYSDQIELWLNGEFHPMCWDRKQVEANQEETLILKGN